MKAKVNPSHAHRMLLSYLSVLLKSSQVKSNRGVTLIELLIGIVISSVVIAGALAGSLPFRQLYLEDQISNDVDGTLRTALDLVGDDLLRVGENMYTTVKYPNLQITNSGTGTSSEVIIRSSRVVALPVCEKVTSGSNTALTVGLRLEGTAFDVVSDPPAAGAETTAKNARDARDVDGCRVGSGADREGNGPGNPPGDGWPDDTLNAWRNFRLNATAPVRARVFNETSSQEFTYDAEEKDPAPTLPVPNGSTADISVLIGTNNYRGEIQKFKIKPASGTTWNADYGPGSLIFIEDVRRYKLQPINPSDLSKGYYLELTINNEPPIRLVSGLSSFQVEVTKRSEPATVPPTLESTFDFCWRNATPTGLIPTPPSVCQDNNKWSQIQSIQITMGAVNPSRSDTLNPRDTDTLRTLSKRFFPRSIVTF
jgi:prepilin-type N-terminal cleavage/methylation domain-containing protein